MSMSFVCRMENCSITHEGCTALASALRANLSHLRILDVSGNNFTSSGVKRLTDDLESSVCNLEMLRQDLPSYNKNVCAWKGFRTKTSLCCSPCRLENCGVTGEGCEALALALKSSSLNLKELNLDWNKIGDLGVQLLFAALENPKCKLEVLR